MKVAVKTFNCPGCAGSITITAAGISVSAVCSSCGAVIDLVDPNYKIIDRVAKELHHANILIPIGTRAAIDNTLWEVIGFQERCDGSRQYFWQEYLLFNPYYGFRFLVESQGHWSFVKLLRKEPVVTTGDNRFFEGRHYSKFINGEAYVVHVIGEFYWRVKIGDHANVKDYVSPPYILSWEENESEGLWSQGRYLAKEEVEKAFNQKIRIPTYGVGANQPNIYKEKLVTTWIVFILCFVFIFLMQLYFGTQANNQTILRETINVSGAVNDKDFVFGPYEINGNIDNVEVQLSGNINNTWTDFDVSLVSETEDSRYDITKGIEYYTGTDSDGAWSEGSKYDSTIISSVPNGVYRILLTPYAEIANPIPVQVSLVRSVTTWTNFLYSIIIIAIYPIFITFRSYFFEAQRWQDSDYPMPGGIQYLDVDND